MVEILSEKDNKLLNRKEVRIIVEAEKNPSFEDAKEVVSSEFKSNKDLIVIKLVKGKFGRDTFRIEAFIYNSKEDMDRVEPKRKTGKGAQPEQEAPNSATS